MTGARNLGSTPITHRLHQKCAGDGLVCTNVVVAAIPDRLKMLALILLCNICNITRI